MTDKKFVARPGSLESQYDASITWRYIAPRDHTLAHCLEPAYWGNVIKEANQQRVTNRHAFNKIEILAEDGSWEAEARVMSAGEGLVHLRLLRQWPEKATEKMPEQPAPEGYRVEYVENNGWRAIEPGGTTLIEKRPTRDEVLRRAQEHSAKARMSPKGAR